MELPPFLEDAPSHFHWNLETDTSKDFDALNLQITEHLEFNPTEMTIQAHLFQSFLHMSDYKRPKPDPANARKCLKEVYDKINALSNEEEKNGFLLVAKTNEALIARKLKVPDTSVEDDVEDLIDIQTPQSKAYVDSVRAFALSRLGLPKYKETEKYYRAAIDVYPDNPQWLFGLALVIGRQARVKAPPFTFTDDMTEEKELYEKALSIDSDHALARSSLAQCLLLKGDMEGAIENAKKAIISQPNNSYLLSMAGRVFRRTKQFDDAISVFNKACELNSKDTYLFHQNGLVYRDKYNLQLADKEKAIKEATTTGEEATYEDPDINLLRQALECFSKAVEANSTNNMALLDNAQTHAKLGMLEEADVDFNSLLATHNLSHRNSFTFNYRYALFLLDTCDNEVKAAQHFKTAIKFAVNHCTKYPVTRENPKPQFVGLYSDINVTIDKFRNIMTMFATLETDKHSEGLKGLAWLHQALGEHDAAKEKYMEYLQCDGKGNDHDAIQQLIKCLIQLDELEGATEKIQILQTLKPRLAKRCKIACLLRQGELALDGQNGTETAKDCFRQAVEGGSMDGCHKLADIVKKEAEAKKSTWEFRVDCAKILQCCEKNNQNTSPLYTDVTNLMELEDELCGTLRRTHLNMEQLILKNDSQDETQEILTAASQVFNEARSLLDRIMSKFKQKHYPLVKCRCMFFHVQLDKSTEPMSEQEVKDNIVRCLNKYKWYDFDKGFPDLLEFLVKIQPAYPGNHDNWYLGFSQLNNIGKHADVLKHSKYHVPVILNGKKAKDVSPIPDGPHVRKVPGVDYEPFTVRDLVRKVTTEVEKIVAEFMQYIHVESVPAR